MTGSALPPQPHGYPAPVHLAGLSPGEPADHRQAIDARVERAVRGTACSRRPPGSARAIAEDLPAFSAMGYREAFDVLAGRRDPASARAIDAQRTWAYARRQRTWFRSEPDIALARRRGRGSRTVPGAR